MLLHVFSPVPPQQGTFVIHATQSWCTHGMFVKMSYLSPRRDGFTQILLYNFKLIYPSGLGITICIKHFHLFDSIFDTTTLCFGFVKQPQPGVIKFSSQINKLESVHSVQIGQNFRWHPPQNFLFKFCFDLFIWAKQNEMSNALWVTLS